MIAFDTYHFAWSPEWYDTFDLEDAVDIGDDSFYPDFYNLHEMMPVTGATVSQGPLYNCLCHAVLKSRGSPQAAVALNALRYLRFKCTMLKTTFPMGVEWSAEEFEICLSRYRLPSELQTSIRAGRMVDDVLGYIRSRLRLLNPGVDVMGLSVPFEVGEGGILAAATAADPKLATYVKHLRAGGLLHALGLEVTRINRPSLSHLGHVGSASELEAFRTFADSWLELKQHYDVMIFYAHSSLYAITNGIEHYCAFEAGTIRSLPFEDRLFGRMIAEGFTQATRVFITNADYVTNEKRLEFKPGQSIYLPHPFDETRAFDFRKSFAKPQRQGGVVRFLCPARQDWRSRDPKLAKANDYIFHAARSLLDDGIGNFHLVCIAWGVDLDASRDLCRALAWKDMCPGSRLRQSGGFGRKCWPATALWISSSSRPWGA